MTRALAVAAIRGYQRFLSPRKGFRCAFGVHTGRGSCSGVGLRAFRRAGVWRGFALLRRQFDRCTMAAADLREAGVYRRLRPPAAQRGDCDLGCDGCPDNLCGDLVAGACDVLDFADCCDRNQRREAEVKRRAEAARERARQRQAEREARRRAGGTRG